MIKILLILVLSSATMSVYSQNSYKTKSGVEYTVGDTIKLGQPLSHLGWISIYKRKEKETYMSNKNLINKKLIIKEIKTESPVIFKFEIYNTIFSIKIDEAIDNKEVIPPFQRTIETKGQMENLKLLEYLKSLYDKGVITKDEYEMEKKKLLRN